MKKAMYAFSADPITYGHIDVVERASKAFDAVVVGIGVNPDKKYMFSLEERKAMAQQALAYLPNVEVVSFQGLLIDFAYEKGVEVIVKGVRNSADFDYENVLHQVGESQKLGIDTHILFARPELAHVSSSVVKGIQKEQGNIEEYVPLPVKQAVEERMLGQYIVGVTGEIGSGKSYVSQQLVALGKKKGIEVHDIELDHIGHQILSDLQDEAYNEAREEVIKTFGETIRNRDGTINRKALGAIVFNDTQALKKLNSIMRTPLQVRLRRELYGKKGLILYNAALIAEADRSHLCNNNVVLIYVDKKTHEKRLSSRGLTSEQMKRRLESQFNFEEKKTVAQEAIDQDNHGQIWIIDNSQGKDEMEKVFDTIVKDLRIKNKII